MDDEHGTMLRRETGEAAFELVSVGGRATGIGLVAYPERRQSKLDDAVSPVPTCLAVAGTDDEAMEPAIEALRIAHRPDVEPGRDQRLLDRVSGGIVASQDQAGRPMQTVERLGGQGREGVLVAGRGPEDEISLHLLPRRW